MRKKKARNSRARPDIMGDVDFDAILELTPDSPENSLSPRAIYAKIHESLTEEQKAAIDVRYPGGFTTRDEANALVLLALRHGPLEAIHAEDAPPLSPEDGPGRISQDEMKSIMIAASENMDRLLRMKEERPVRYFDLIFTTNFQRCEQWER